MDGMSIEQTATRVVVGERLRTYVVLGVEASIFWFFPSPIRCTIRSFTVRSVKEETRWA